MKKNVLLIICLLSIFLAIGGYAADGKLVYEKCAGCHGQDGKTKAFGRGGPINGFSAQEVSDKLMMYRSDDFKAEGVVKVMVKNAKKLSPEEISAVSEYISTLKK